MKNYKIWSSSITSLTDSQLKSYKEDYYEAYEEEPTEDELFRYIQDDIDRTFEDEMSNINSHERKHGPKYYIIVGSLHRWHGDVLVSKVVESMKEVIAVCSNGEEDINIYFKNGLMRIDGFNHDSETSGDYFKIRELTDKGYQYYDDHLHDMDDAKMVERLFKDSRYSHAVSIFTEMYGC